MLKLGKNFIQSQEVMKLNGKVAIAVSGGADSMCLALLAQQYCSDIIAIIVDHGLRVESGKEAKLVQKRLKALNIDSEILKWEGKKPSSNIQEKAREARYNLLFEYCKKHKIKQLMVGHTKNDQAETVLMRILRGSGIDGISGIKKVEKRKGITIIRPLLDYTREEIIKTLKHYKVKWVEDPSNLNEKYERIRIRNLINSQKDASVWVNRLSLLSSNARRARNFLESEVNAFIKKHVKLSNLGYVSFNVDDIENLHEEMRLRVLSKLLLLVSGRKRRNRLTSLEKVDLRKTNTLWDSITRNLKGICYIYKEPASVKNVISGGIWDNRFKIKAPRSAVIKQLSIKDWEKLKEISEIKLPIHDIVFSLPVVLNSDGKVIGFPLAKKLEVQIDFIRKL